MTIPEEQLILTHRYGTDGVLYLSAKGRITNDKLNTYAQWSSEVKAMIRERAEAGDNPILVLSDISGVSHVERKPVAILRELLTHDKQFPIRSAIVGNNHFVMLILDSIISLLHRNNVRYFNDTQSALKWLYAGKKKS